MFRRGDLLAIDAYFIRVRNEKIVRAEFDD